MITWDDPPPGHDKQQMFCKSSNEKAELGSAWSSFPVGIQEQPSPARSPTGQALVPEVMTESLAMW